MSSHRYSRKWKNFRKRYAERELQRVYSADGKCSGCARYWTRCNCPEKFSSEMEVAMEWRMIAHQLQGGRSAAPN